MSESWNFVGTRVGWQTCLLLFGFVFSTNSVAAASQRKFESITPTKEQSLIPELDWDFHGRLAVLPLQNKGDQEFDWVSIAIQDALTQDFWHVEAFDTRSLRTFSGKFTELCPKLDLRCVATQPSNELQKTLSDQFLSYAVIGDYNVDGDQVEITLSWGYARDIADHLPGPEGIVVTSTLENMTDDLSQSLLKWVKDRSIELSSEHATRFEQPKTHIIPALKATALGYWSHQEYYLNKEDQALIARWEEHLVTATKVDVEFPQAWNHLGGLYLNLGNKEKALQAFSKSVKLDVTSLDAQAGLGFTQPDTPEGKDITLKLKKALAGLNRGNFANQSNLAAEFVNRKHYEQALPFRLRQLGIANKIFMSRPAKMWSYYFDVAHTYMSISDYLTSKTYFYKTLSLIERVRSKDQIRLGDTLKSLGFIYRSLGDLRKSLDYYKRSLAINVTKNGIRHVSSSNLLDNLGFICFKLGDFQKSLEYYESLLAVKTIASGEGHIDTANPLHSVGAVSYELSNFQKSLDYLNRSLAIKVAKHGTDHISTAMSLNILSLIYDDLGDYSKALEYQRRSLAVKVAKYGDGHISTAVSLNNLGNIYDDLKDYMKAKDYFERALSIYETKYGKGNFNTALVVSNLGYVNNKLGENQKAIDYLTQSLAISQAKYGDDHISMVHALNHLGNTYQDLGSTAKAIEFHKRSLSIKEAKYGEGHISTVDSLNNLGIAYGKLGDHTKAIEFHKRSLLLKEAKYGEGHISTVDSLNNLGIAFSELEDHPKAIEYHERSLTISETKHREGHISTTSSLSNLGSNYFKLNNFPKAIYYHERSLSIQVAKFGEGHFSTADSLDNLGNAYTELGRHEKAVKHFVRALEIREAKNGEGHISTADSLNNLGVVYNKLGNYSKAIDFHERSLSIRAGKHGEDDISTADSLNNLGNVYNELGRYQNAIEYYIHSLSIKDATFGKGHINAVDSLNNLGSVYTTLGNYSKAIGYLKSSLAIKEATYGKDDTRTADSLSNLGILYFELGEYSKAIGVFQRSLEIIGGKYGTGRAEVLNNLGSAYYQLGNNPKAIEYLGSSLEIKESNYGVDNLSRASSYSNLGRIYADLGEFSKAIEYHEHSLEINEGKYGNGHISTVGSLNNLGVTYFKTHDYLTAVDYFERSLAISKLTHGKNHISTADFLNNLSQAWKARQKLKLAIAYGKQAVNILQKSRASLSTLDKELQDAYKKSVQSTYQRLAQLLFEEGEIAMGEQVLRMLKDTERTLYRSKSDGKAERLTMAAAEQLALKKISTYHRDSTRFEQLKGQSNRSAAEQTEYTRLRQLMRAGTLEAIVDALEKAMTAAPMNPDLNSSSKTAELLKALKDESGEKAALLYLFISDDKFSHVLITPDKKPLVVNTPIDTKELYQRIPLLRRALTPELGDVAVLSSVDEKEQFWSENHQELMKHSHWLYKEMIEPVQEQLKASGTQTLMVYLDGPLRYLPVAALHDGEKYLLESYKLSLLTGSPENAIGDKSTLRKLQIAAMGTDEYYKSPEGQVFESLQAVDDELRAVASEHFWEGGSFGGERFFREEFSPSNFYKLSAEGEYPLFHLATHFYMRPGDSGRSFLLFGGPEAVTVDTLIKNWIPKNVEILTLSACSTALSTGGQSASGDGRGVLEVLTKNTSGAEVDSFASSLIIEKNITTVIATLWNIEDQSAAKFMEKFYSYLPDDKRYTRVGALRQAQLDLLKNKVTLSKGNKQSLKQIYGLKDYSHPVFWAPFIMMGQWM